MGRAKTFAMCMISLGLILPYCSAFAEEEKAGEKSVVDAITGVKEAYAMPVPAPIPSNIITVYDKTAFINYINHPMPSRFSEERFTREEFEEVPMYRGIYAVDDGKKELEEKITSPINESKWKEGAGIEKISTKFGKDDLKLQVRFKEKKEKPKSILGRIFDMMTGKADKIIGRINYKANMAELRAVNEF